MEDANATVARANATKTGFHKFDHGATDTILAAEFNSSGTHLAVCSADHKIRLFAVKWIGASLGLVFGTIGEDNKFKLWREDPSQAFQSGRRFRCVYSQSPSNHVSYVSLGFKTLRHEVWLVLTSRDGLLGLLEPSEQESLQAWKEIDTTYPFGQQSRGSEPTFRLSLHESETPSYGALSAGLDPRAISLCLSANTSIKILRAIRSDDGNYQFQNMLEVGSIPSAINDVSWAPGSIRLHDLIAAACDDGCVRVYAVTTLHNSRLAPASLGACQDSPTKDRHNMSLATRQAPSGIGAGLAGVSRAEAIRRSSGGLHMQHSWTEVALLPHEVGAPVWRVQWTHDGSTIASTGDSGKLHLWKQDLKGNFVEFAETGPAWGT